MSSSQHRCIFVGNIPYDTTEDQLVRICEEVGPVVSFRLVHDRESGKPKGYGFCEYRDEETALNAQRNLHGYEINGRQLRVAFAENDKGSVDRTKEQGRGGIGPSQNTEVPKPLSLPRAATDLSVNSSVGFGLVASAATALDGVTSTSQMSSMVSQGNLGNANPKNAAAIDATAVGADALTNQLAGMSKHQLYQIVSQMKDLIHQNQQQARQILIANPQLTKALFQAQIMLGMVRAPDTSALPSVPAQAPQQHPAQPQAPQVPTVQPAQVVNMPQPLPIQQTPSQQGQPQMLSPHLQVHQSQAPSAVVQPNQSSFPFQQPVQSQSSSAAVQPNQSSFPFQHPVQLHQQSNPPTNLMLPLSQSAPPSSLQQAPPQPPLPSHAPPLPQQPRPPGPPSQLQHQNTQGMGFHPPPGSQSYHPQPPYQQQGGPPQMNAGLPFQQLHPPLPNQPPPQHMFQMPRNGADIGASAGIGQGGILSMGVPSQAGRGPSMGVPTVSASLMAWNQPLPSSGSMVAPQAPAPVGVAGHMVPGHHSFVGGSGNTSSLAGGPGLNHSQGYGQPQPQQQLQHQPQMPIELEQQKALLQQVMNLTLEQINSLPPEQRQQVLQLQQAFRSQTG